MNNELKLNNYVKVVYQSEPIGKEKIVLYLTTFDLEAFEKDKKLKQIPKKIEISCYDFNKLALKNPDYVYELQIMLEDMIDYKYKSEIEKMKKEIERLKEIKFAPQIYDNNVKNINNSDDVHCNIVYGNITNCDNIYCNTIKGNVVNCDKIIYKK